MDANTAEALDHLICQLDAQILATEGLGVPGTRLLLSMARLDLQAKRHDIEPDELKTLCSTVERALARNDRSRRRAAAPARRTRSARPKFAAGTSVAG